MRSFSFRRALTSVALCTTLLAGQAQAQPQEGGVLNLVAQPEPPSLMHGVVSMCRPNT